jgi:hypothetical protein
LLGVAGLVVLLLTAMWIAADSLASPRVANADDVDVLCPAASPPDAPPPMVSGRSPRLARICFVPRLSVDFDTLLKMTDQAATSGPGGAGVRVTA